MSTVAGERVGDDQRRRGQVGGAHLRVDAPLEVAVAAQHRHDHQVLVAHDLGDRLRQRAAELPMQLWTATVPAMKACRSSTDEVEDGARASGSPVDHLEREGRQRQRFFLDAVALAAPASPA